MPEVHGEVTVAHGGTAVARPTTGARGARINEGGERASRTESLPLTLQVSTQLQFTQLNVDYILISHIL